MNIEFYLNKNIHIKGGSKVLNIFLHFFSESTNGVTMFQTTFLDTSLFTYKKLYIDFLSQRIL